MYRIPAKHEKKSRVTANRTASGTALIKKNVPTPITTMIVPVLACVFNSCLTLFNRLLNEFPSSRMDDFIVIGKHMAAENAHTAGSVKP